MYWVVVNQSGVYRPLVYYLMFQTCPDGTYSTAGADACITCPSGKYCWSGSLFVSPTDCEAGTYSRRGDNICYDCNPGRFQTGFYSEIP